jgi:hypothetical protein
LFDAYSPPEEDSLFAFSDFLFRLFCCPRLIEPLLRKAKIKLALLTRKGKIETQFLPDGLILWQSSEENDEKMPKA